MHGPDPQYHQPFKTTETRQRRCPPQGEGIFAYFCCRTKVRRLAGRDPPVLPLVLKKDQEQQINGLLLSFSIKETKLYFVGNNCVFTQVQLFGELGRVTLFHVLANIKTIQPMD